MLRALAFSVTLAVVLNFSSAFAQWGDFLKKLGLDPKQQLSEETVVSGLKEALQIGTTNTTETTGKVDGYFRNEAIKILLPDKIKSVEKGLRLFGYGEDIDQFILSMNRAAEAAAPQAKEMFWDAIKEMSIQDAHQILTGGDTAATDYFRKATGDELSEVFHPIVSKAMEDVGVTRQYKDLVGQFEALPFGSVGALDLDRYVVDKALDGLFHVLAEEERKIRTNPAARVTDLLQKVFG